MLVLAALWGGSFLLMCISACELGPLALGAVRVMGLGCAAILLDTARTTGLLKPGRA